MRIIIPFLFALILFNPGHSQDSDTLVLRINFIVIQKSNGNGNFSRQDSLGVDYLNKAVNRLNELISLKKSLIPQNSCSLKHTFNDSRIRFRLNKILEIKNDSLWDNEQDKNWKHCPGRTNWYLLTLQKELDSIMEPEDHGINIYLTVSEKHYKEIQNNPDSIKDNFPQYACSMFPSKHTNDFSAIHFPNAYLKYLFMKQYPYEWGFGTLGRGLAHELGHSLGLTHTISCNNIMIGKGTTNRKNLTDEQIKLARKNIKTTNLSRYRDP